MRPRRRSETLHGVYKRLFNSYGPQGWWPGEGALEIIVGAILTQNTVWANVEKAIANLKEAGLLDSADALEKIPAGSLGRLIKPSGYYNVKAKRLKNFTSFLKSRYGGKLERLSRRKPAVLRKELLSVSGIGPETADSILLYAFGKTVFVVDAYTKRIFSRHGLFGEEASYEEVRKIFEEGIPADDRVFNEFHALIVRLGKERCRKQPRCEGCPLRGLKILAKKGKG